MSASLVVLAHYDDEFFLAPVLRDEAAAGQLWVAYLTCSHEQGRRAESQAALTGLGVDAAHILQVGDSAGIDDGALSLDPAGALAALRSGLEPEQFQRIYLMAWEGGHPDHDTAHVVGRAFARGTAELLEFPLYNAAGAPKGFFHSLRLTPGVMPVRERHLTPEEAGWWRSLISAYPSQQAVFKHMLPSIDWCLEVRRSCTYREVDPARDYSRRPHAGPLGYELFFGLSFETLRTRLARL